MANLVNQLLTESAQNASATQNNVAQKLAKKWAPSGLLKNLDGQDKNTMAVILENQAKQLVSEASTSGGGLSNTSSPVGATFTPGGVNSGLALRFPWFARSSVNWLLRNSYLYSL